MPVSRDWNETACCYRCESPVLAFQVYEVEMSKKYEAIGRALSLLMCWFESQAQGGKVSKKQTCPLEETRGCVTAKSKTIVVT